MGIIPVSWLQRELPNEANDGDDVLTNAIEDASAFVNCYAVNYETFPDYTETDTINAPLPISRITLQVAKLYYYQGLGRINRDGNENQLLTDELNDYKIQLKNIDIQPTVHSVTISLNSDGVQLIARKQHILKDHYDCKVVSGSSNIWNQYYHWTIRRGNDSDSEYLDGWYLDAETYKDSIEGTLYYARSWKNNGLDYLRYTRVFR